MNHFELFGLPEQFALDVTLLGERYRLLQAQFHPDRAATQSEGERLRAVTQAALINAAYTTLKSPLQRAAYLLELKGVELPRTLHDIEFLQAQISLRERLEECRDADELWAFESEIKAQQKRLFNQFETALAADLTLAAALILKLKFIDKLLEELSRLDESLQG